jgi:DNA repair exonuclease SbcCD ATPase subunit
MRIVKFSAENIKKLRAVEITPAGNLVEITGPNGQGKSSVLDAIYYALKGAAADIPSAVVRQGEESAIIKLDLGELRVTRRFNKSGATTLVVESEKGARFPSPQRMLDELIGALSFDPLEFTRLKPKEQLSALRSVVKLDRDLDALDAETKEVFDQRTATNRVVRELETRLAAIPRAPEGTPDEPVNISEIAKVLDSAGKLNAEREVLIKKREQLEKDIQRQQKQADERVELAKNERAEAERQIENIKVNLNATIARLQKEELTLRQRAKEDEQILTITIPLDLIDTAELVAQVNQAQVTNKQVELKKQRAKLTESLKAETVKMEDQTKTIETNKALRDATIAAAQMPVDGLAFGNGEVLYDSLPLNVASSAEQLRVSVALAMAANPKLRVLRIKDGSLLDETNLAALAELCSASDYQLWIERVEEAHGRPCVIMEDGSVRT